MTFSIRFIVAFFNNKPAIEILRKIFYFVIADCIYMLGIWIGFPFRLHLIKLLLVIKMSCHHSCKIIKFHLGIYLHNQIYNVGDKSLQL